jgi:hypothetical protein
MKVKKIYSEIINVVIKITITSVFFSELLATTLILEVPSLMELLYSAYDKQKKQDKSSFLTCEYTKKQKWRRLTLFVLSSVFLFMLLKKHEDTYDLSMKILIRNSALISRFMLDSVEMTIKKRLRKRQTNRNRK